MACDGREDPARAEVAFVINDSERGNVKMQFYDRISIDDVTVHIIERELFRVVGGNPPGDDLNQKFKDFLIRENFLEVI
jgi:hypothetical protein